MATLEQLLVHEGTAFGLLTPKGTFVHAEFPSERGKYAAEMHRMAASYTNFLKKHGMGLITYTDSNTLRGTRLKIGKINGKKRIIAYPSKSKPYQTLEKYLAGVGSVRLSYGVVGAMIRPTTSPNKRYIVSN